MNVPPIIAEFELPKTDARRNYLGWILLFFIAGFMIYTATKYYIQGSQDEQQSAKVCDDALRAAVQATSTSKKRLWKTFDRNVNRRFLKKDVLRLALFRSVSAYERNLPIAPEDIKTLETSKLTRHRSLARLYESKTLDMQAAKRYTKTFEVPGFVYKLASVHALEKAGDRTARREITPKIGPVGISWSYVFAALILAGAVLGLAIIGVYIGLRSAGYLKPLGHPFGEITLFGADRCALRGAQVFLIIFGVAFVAAPIGRLIPGASSTINSLLYEALSLFGVILLSFRPVLGKSLSYARLGLTGERLWHNILWGIAGLFASIPLLIGSNIVSGVLFRGLPQVEHPAVSELKNTSSALAILSLALSACVCAPIIEETVFRGMLLPAFARIMKSPVWAMAITSILFAAFHQTGLPSWLTIATVGCVGALLTYQTRSLLPAMILHALYNGSLLFMVMFMGK